MEFIIVLIIALILTYVIFLVIDWLIHINMTKDFKQYGWASFKIFKREFDNTKWDDPNGKYGLFKSDVSCISTRSSECMSVRKSSMYFCNRIKFNGIGMIMKTPFSYLRTKIYVKKYINKLKKYKWK